MFEFPPLGHVDEWSGLAHLIIALRGYSGQRKMVPSAAI